MTKQNLFDVSGDDSPDTPYSFFTIQENTNADLVGKFEHGSDEWHDARARGIGGSEVGTICGLNRWESPYTLWAKKTGRIPSSIAQSEAMEWGNRLEPVILEKFADEHPELDVLLNVGTWSHPDRSWQIANPDALYVTKEGSYGIVEVKTAQFEDDWSEGVPRYYETQVQWYLQTLGLEKAYVVALFHGNRYKEFEVIASAIAQDAALEQVEAFREFLLTDEEPAYDGSLSTYNSVRAVHPEIEDAEVELGYLGEQFFLLDAKYKEAETELTKLKAHILGAMGNAKRGLVHGEWTFSRSARGSGTPFLTIKRG